MLRIKHAIIVLGVLLACTAPSPADPIDVKGSGAFKAYDPSGAYWGMPTGGEGHVGLHLTTTLGIPSGDLLQYGTGSDGKGEPSVIKFDAGGATVTTTLKLEFAGYAPSNTLYYWDSVSSHNIIFTGSATGGSVAYITAVGDFWLDLHSPDGIFHSDTTAYSGSDSIQHFAVFKQSNGTLWVGVEDLTGGGDRDYNDMIFSMSAVPEPASMVILGIGGLMVGGAALRRRKQLA